MRWVLLVVLGLGCILGGSARAQQPPASVESGAELRVFLMTFGPGSVIYERFGHNAIVIHDPNPSAERIAERLAFEAKLGGRLKQVPPFNTTDRAHHYGAFGFEQKGFVVRFVMGRMEYWTTSEWADLTALAYKADNRSVLLQELNLTPRQKLTLKEFVETNERPENRFYRYDYYRDNCSTRVRDAIAKAVGDGELERQLKAVRTGTTYRSHTRRLTSGLDPLDIFWFTSFTYVMGHPVDQPLSAWEESFLPDKLAEHLRSVTLSDGGGGTATLVLSEQQLSSTTRRPMPATSPSRISAYLVAGLLIGGLFSGLAWVSVRSRLARVGFMLLVVPWALVWGLGSLIAANGWAVTDHSASYRNENLLQMSPLILPLAMLGPTLVLGRRRGARVAVVLAIIIAALSVLGLLLKVLPAFWQHNGEMLALCVPANIGMAVATLILARRATAITAVDPATAAPTKRPLKREL
jgi:hypothetical protein